VNILKNYKNYIYSILFGLIVILTISLSLPLFAQFTPTQNAYLNRNELLKNSDAEQGIAGWVNGAGVVSSVTTDYFSGSRSFQIVLTAQTLSFCQSQTTSTLLSNASLNASCRIKTTNGNIQICNNVNGVNQNCNTVSGSGSWESSNASANFITGNSTSGLCIISTAPITATLRIDNCSLVEEILPSPSFLGNVLTSDGTEWTSAPLPLFINSLNSLTTTQQYFATSSTGTNFTISSSVDTHTFNLPIASAVNTGKLSNTDWTTFNNKEPAITVLPVTKGGTGAGSLTLNNVILGNGTSAVQFVAPSTLGKVLISNGTTWTSDFLDYDDLTNTPLNVSDFYNDAGYVSGPVSAVDGEIAVFNLTTGKVIRSAVGTGVAHLTSGVLSVSNVNLASEVTGVLLRANGGTGLSAVGALGNVLTSDGTNWISAPSSGGAGNISLFNASDLTLTGGDQIALSVVSGDAIQKWLVQGDVAPITMSNTPFSGVVTDGTEIKLIGNDDTNTVEFTNNDIAGGCILNGNAILLKYYFLTLVYDATLDRYIEKSRNF